MQVMEIRTYIHNENEEQYHVHGIVSNHLCGQLGHEDPKAVGRETKISINSLARLPIGQLGQHRIISTYYNSHCTMIPKK
jgi:hypothetical protein